MRQSGLGLFWLLVGDECEFFLYFWKKDLPITLLSKQFKSTFATDLFTWLITR